MAKKSKKKEPSRKPGAAKGPPAGGSGFALRFLAAGVVLAALAVAGYSNSFTGEWHLDDVSNITQNPYIQIRSLQPAALLGAMRADGKQNRFISNLTFALNYYFNGKETWGYHLVNLILHFLTGLAAFLVLDFTFRRAGWPERRSAWAALAAAGAWTVHPIQTQAVTYVVQRQTVMASALMLGTFAAYLAARANPVRRRKIALYAVAGLAMVLAVGSKEIALVTPALILVYEFYFFQDFSLAFLRRHPLALVLALVLAAAVLGIYLRPTMWTKLAQSYQNFPFTPGQRLLTEPRVLFQYLGLILWPLPSRLNLEHDPAVSVSLFNPWTTLPALLGWGILLALALRFGRRYRLASFALLWYLGNLFLESSFLPLDLMFEHRLYLPSLAVVVPLIAGAIACLPRLRGSGLGLGLLLVLLLLNTRARNQAWQTDLGLWRDAARNAPENARVFNRLGVACLREARTRQALWAFTRALELNPRFAGAFNSRGNVEVEMGLSDQAIADFSHALALDPHYAVAYSNRGRAFHSLGRNREAFADFSQALRLDPNLTPAYYNRGMAWMEEKQYQQSIDDFSQVIARLPDNADVYFQRGRAFAQNGQPDLARADWAKARSLRRTR